MRLSRLQTRIILTWDSPQCFIDKASAILDKKLIAPTINSHEESLLNSKKMYKIRGGISNGSAQQ